MNIDERLEKLSERHQALAESVELLNQSIHEQGANIDRLGVNIDKLIANSAQDAENIRALARIAELHQQRIEKLEERQN
jgi:uncharacterized coiled-coil protein SlyX